MPIQKSSEGMPYCNYVDVQDGSWSRAMSLGQFSIDAFSRLRVSNPETLFASKLLWDKSPLVWDESITDGSGNAASTHSTANAAVTLHAESGDTLIRQTRSRFNYQPGNGQLGLFTGVLFIAYEWLGVGAVFAGFVVNGFPVVCHVFEHFNALTTPYMATPNHPVRYEITSTGDTAELVQICCTVLSEGGVEVRGVAHSASTDGTHVNANAEDTIYGVIGIRQKTSCLDAVIRPRSISMIAETNDNFGWMLLLNPTLAADLSWSDLDNSCVQVGSHDGANPGGHTIAEGAWDLRIDSGFATQEVAASEVIDSTYSLGSLIDGTRDEVILAVRPLSPNLDVQGAIHWLEQT